MAAFQSKTVGLKEFLAKVKALGKLAKTDAGLEVLPSRGTAYRRRKKTEAQRPTLAALNKAIGRTLGEVQQYRGVGFNMRIWNTQKSRGRNPFHYRKSDGNKIWLAGAKRAVRIRTGHADVIEHAGQRVAELMMKTVQENIDSRRGIAPNRGRYAKWKEKRWQGEKPPLELSGQLREALKPVVLRK
jgi:hypothetical protein